MLFSDAVEIYLEDKAKRVRGNTMEGYLSALRRHVLPAFGGREVEEITHDEVQAWVDSIPTYGAAGKAYKTFRQVYRWIVRQKQMRIWDVTQGIELPEAPVVRRPTVTAAEEQRTLRGIVGQAWEAVVLLEAALGLRRCEACGVDWSDVDWRTGWVHIQRGAHWVGGRLVEYATKTKLSDRWLKLPRWALARLRQIRGQRKAGRVRGGLAPHQVAGRFRRFCHRMHLPWVPMTCLRHSWATISLEAGAAIEDVSVALGHSTVDTCIQHYLQSFRTVVGRASDAYATAMLKAAQLSVSQVLWEGSATVIDETFPGISAKRYLLFDFAIDGKYSGTSIARVAQGMGEASAISIFGQSLRVSRIVFNMDGDRISCGSGNINYYNFLLKLGSALTFNDGTFARVTRISAMQLSVSQFVTVEYDEPETVAGETVTTEVSLPVIDGMVPISVANIFIRRPGSDLVSGIVDPVGHRAYITIYSRNSVSAAPGQSIVVEYRHVQLSVSQRPRVIIGTDIWSCGAAQKFVQMWTRQQFIDKFGRAFNNSYDCIVAMNGDAAAQGYGKVLGCYYDSGTIGCYVDGHVDGVIRLNYAVFLH